MRSSIPYRGVHGIILRLGRGGVNGIKRGVQRMPWQNCAFYPRRQIANPCENRQPPQVVRTFNVELANGHIAEFLNHCFRVGTCLTFDDSRHH